MSTPDHTPEPPDELQLNPDTIEDLDAGADPVGGAVVPSFRGTCDACV